MATRIQIRRDTAANWALENPVLSSGELGFETDTKLFKCGDGTTNYNSLVYITHISIDALDNTLEFNSTSAVTLPSGTTLQRPGTPTAGDIRWNTTDTTAELWDGTQWGPVGGGASETGFVAHANVVSDAQTIDSGYNGVTGGPITITPTGSVTVSTGSTWTIV